MTTRSGTSPVRTVAVSVAGGKGDVGTSAIETDLAVALVRTLPDVLPFDADPPGGSIAALHDLPPCSSWPASLAGSMLPSASIRRCPAGIGAITDSPERAELSRLSRIDQPAIIARFSEPGVAADTLFVDTPSGLSDTASGDAAVLRDVPMVITCQPDALRDAISFVRGSSRRGRARRFRPAVRACEGIKGASSIPSQALNRACSARHARDVHAGLFARTGPGPDVQIESAGAIPDDDHVVRPVRGGCAVVGMFPRSPPALAFTKLAARVASWPGPAAPAGRIEYFVERLIRAADPTLVRVTA